LSYLAERPFEILVHSRAAQSIYKFGFLQHKAFLSGHLARAG
jgi:hypothetical protein